MQQQRTSSAISDLLKTLNQVSPQRRLQEEKERTLVRGSSGGAQWPFCHPAQTLHAPPTHPCLAPPAPLPAPLTPPCTLPPRPPAPSL